MRKEQECDSCGMGYAIVFEEDNSIEDPSHCPFCGEVADQSELDLDESYDTDDYDYDD